MMGWMGFGWLIPIALIALVVWAFMGNGGRSRLDSPGGAGRIDDPMRILKARYAKGEIDRDEYLQMKDELRRD